MPSKKKYLLLGSTLGGKVGWYFPDKHGEKCSTQVCHKDISAI